MKVNIFIWIIFLTVSAINCDSENNFDDYDDILDDILPEIDFKSLRDVGKGVLSGVFKSFDTLAQFLTGQLKSLPFDEAVQIFCANPTNRTFERIYMSDPNTEQILDVSKEIGFLVHGWLSTSNVLWMLAVSQDWVRYRDSNVCRINWERLSYDGYVLAGSRNTRLVADQITQFIISLEPFGIFPENVTIVGHSLGAHLSGYVGQNFDSRIKRIIGLDAAGPLFTMPYALPTEFRLDRSDAQQVVMIHSSSGFLGVSIPSGHQDFYGNGGIAPQDGCIYPNYFPTYAYDPIACSHDRAIDFFQSSLNPEHKCEAIQCDNLIKYGLRKCNPVTNRLGLDAHQNATGLFYFSTGGKPYCNGQYWWR